MVKLNRKVIRNFFLLVVILLILADLIGPYIGITSLFRLDDSSSIGVWFESFLYLNSAGLLALAAITQSQRKQSGAWRWGVLAIFMLYLSIDTTASLNRKIVDHLTGATWWVAVRVYDIVLFVTLVIALLVIFGPVLIKLPARYRNMMIFSGIVFATGAILVDAVGSFLFKGNNSWLYHIEEFLEFSGFVLFIDAMLAYLGAQTGEIKLVLRPDGQPDSEGS